jgi:hypothetical protein
MVKSAVPSEASTDAVVLSMQPLPSLRREAVPNFF